MRKTFHRMRLLGEGPLPRASIGRGRFTLEIGAMPVALVGMAKSRAARGATLPARGPDGAERHRVADYADSGHPVDDLPPFVEAIGFDEPVKDEATEPPTKDQWAAGQATEAKAEERPARQEAAEPASPAAGEPPLPRFLAAPDHAAGPLPSADTEPVEPAEAKRRERFSAWRERVQGALKRWPEAARAALPSDRRPRIAIAAAVAVLIVAVVVIAGLGAFSRGRNYRTAPPPNDPAARFAFYRAGAKAGDADAELQLAILYAKGEGVAQDYASAATWFRAAAEQGVARAQYDLGVLYERGRGVQIDLKEAADWYLKAANGKFPLAEYNLAVCYTKGQGIRQDLPEATLWYRRAAGHGVVQAMINLGMMYEKGDGIAASPVDAYAWYLAAGQRGNQTAAQRAQDLFTSLPRLDQIRAEALASDVAASIRNPEPERGEAATEKPDAKPNTPNH